MDLVKDLTYLKLLILLDTYIDYYLYLFYKNIAMNLTYLKLLMLLDACIDYKKLNIIRYI